ncbi:PREDICTED: histone-lysine N-methyltransferase 2D-like, partial [Tinamus guttatus]|uniref:histone-lysine N-methyltransferase 2D-like n=1 Tax=Tinamus guttatus TaxID=94827 RepID=UPI00052EEEF4
MEELPKMESKDVQQLFKDVLGSAERGEQPLNCVAAGTEAGVAGQDPGRAQLSQRPFLQGDLQLPGQGSVSLGSLSGSVSLDSYPGVCQSPFLDNRERSGFFSPDHCEPESPWASSSAATTPSTPTTPTTEGEGDGLSYNQRSLQRWEKDEELGELSTISPVLYANMNFPNLKQDYPDWSSRCKQIMKLWRKVPATDKAPYLQKAKDNRAAHRINKVQKQAESQINKQTKGEGLRKPERPSRHLRIPVPPGAQPLYMGSPPGAGEGFLKPPAGAGAGPESPSELFLKLPPQSPAQVPSHDPYGAAPAYAPEPRFPSPLGQSPTAAHVAARPLPPGATLRPDGPKDGPVPDPAPALAPGKSHLGLEGGRLPCEVPVEPDLDDDFGSHKDLEDDDLANLSLDPDVAKGDDDLDNLDNLDKFAAEDIMDPIAKAKMVALKGIKKVMAQGSIGVAPGMNRQQVSLLAQRLSGAPAVSEMQNHMLAGGSQDRSGADPSQARPNPPSFAQGVINEADQRQYEEWLFHTQQLLQMQLKVLEEQIGAHRKSRKALCAKQRTAKKAGREFPEADAEKLKLVTEQQSKIQKQLDQ